MVRRTGKARLGRRTGVGIAHAKVTRVGERKAAGVQMSMPTTSCRKERENGTKIIG